jgi:catechol 2,3-dioxygenase-like lactoylglutathione lyase family enzyme
MAVSPPLLNRLNLVVRDMDATLSFYRRLGLAIPVTAVWRTTSGGHDAEVTMPNGLRLEFDSAMAAAYNPGWREPRGSETRQGRA